MEGNLIIYDINMQSFHNCNAFWIAIHIDIFKLCCEILWLLVAKKILKKKKGPTIVTCDCLLPLVGFQWWNRVCCGDMGFEVGSFLFVLRSHSQINYSSPACLSSFLFVCIQMETKDHFTYILVKPILNIFPFCWSKHMGICSDITMLLVCIHSFKNSQLKFVRKTLYNLQDLPEASLEPSHFHWRNYYLWFR